MNEQEMAKAVIDRLGKKLQLYRNSVLEGYNFTDLLISGMISQYYFGKYNEKFVSNVLYSTSMTSSGRIGILREILKETGLYEKKLFDNLEKMAKIRNYFAHGSYIFFWLELLFGIKQEKISMYNPKHLPKSSEEKFDCEKEYNNFLIFNKNATEILTDIYKKIEKHTQNKIGKA
jgi:hypothetical protein